MSNAKTADQVLRRIHAALTDNRTVWAPPAMCGFTRSDSFSVTGAIELFSVNTSMGMGARSTPADLSESQREAMTPAVKRLGFPSIEELWDWEDAPERTDDEVITRLQTVLTDSAQGIVREARRLLNERGWNPLGGALDARGTECKPSDRGAQSYSITAAVYATVWPRERLESNNDSDRVIPTDYILRLLSHAIPQAPGTPKAKPCRNNPPLDVAWMLLEDYEQAQGRTVAEITALFDRAIELENELESLHGRIDPMPLDAAWRRSLPSMAHEAPQDTAAEHAVA